MWTVIKFDKKKISFLKKDFKEKIGNDSIFYFPKILIKKKHDSGKEVSLLGDYIFCYNKNFENKDILNILKFSRGVQYFLEGFISSQKEIEIFINYCKKLENEKGYISKNIFEIIENKKYKFQSGPFTNQIFKIVGIQKNKINILIGNLKTKIETHDFLFHPV